MKRRGRVKYNIEYKIYFETKNKEKIINKKMATELKELLKEICKEMHIEIIRGKIEENGVKLKINTPPNLSVSAIVKQIKGKTSKIILKEKTWEGGYRVTI